MCVGVLWFWTYCICIMQSLSLFLPYLPYTAVRLHSDPNPVPIVIIRVNTTFSCPTRQLTTRKLLHATKLKNIFFTLLLLYSVLRFESITQ